MKIKVMTKGNFTLVPEGERVLKITKAECTPSGKPSRLKLTFQDTDGGIINSQYSFDNDKALFAMGKLLEVVLGFDDGDEFDTKTDCERLINKIIIGEVVHTEGTKPNENGELPIFANLKKVISLVDTATGEVESSPRNEISNDDDLD